jgi:hypothetical protein
LLKYIRKKPDELRDQKYISVGFNRQKLDSLIYKYTNILKSSIGILYAIRSELDAMKLMLERNKNVPIARMNERLDLLGNNVLNVLELDKEEIEMILDRFDDCIDAKTYKEKIEILDDLMKSLKLIINWWTINYFNQEGLNPLKFPLVPKHLRYDSKIIRKPDDDPKNPLKEALAKYEKKRKGGFLGSIAKSLFMRVANYYRRNYCNGKARPLYPGEYHLGCHNFTGPGTRIDLPEVRNYAPYNDIDACSRQHDLDYYNAFKLPDAEKKKLIREADHRVIECYNKYPNESGYNASKLGINSKMGLENVIPIVARSVLGKISAAGDWI